MTRILSRIGIAFAILAMNATAALAQATVPVVKSPSGVPEAATAVICVDLSGAYVGCGAGGGGAGAVYGPTLTGSPAANPPVLVGGTTDGTGTGTISNLKIDPSGNASVTATNPYNLEATQLLMRADIATIAGAIGTAIPGQSAHGINIGGVEGVSASGASDTDNPLNDGGRAATTLPTAVADGQKVARMLTKDGKGVVVLNAPEPLRVRGTATTTGNTATTLIGAQGSGITMEVTGIQCFRTDNATTEVHVTLNDTEATGSGTQIPVPPTTAGAAFTFQTPLLVAANTALTYTPSASITSITCNGQGNQAH